MKINGKQLLKSHQSGVYQFIRRADEMQHAAKDAGLAVFRIDVGGMHTKQDFLAHVAAVLSFPNWFGGNWDALGDCLADLEWLPTKTGYVLVFENIEQFSARN